MEEKFDTKKRRGSLDAGRAFAHPARVCELLTERVPPRLFEQILGDKDGKDDLDFPNYETNKRRRANCHVTQNEQPHEH